MLQLEDDDDDGIMKYGCQNEDMNILLVNLISLMDWNFRNIYK